MTFLVCLFIALVFSFPMFFGAPFLPTRPSRVKPALDLLDLKPGQTMLELGSGDGRLLREAARRGIQATGYELNPILVLYSRLLALPYRQLVTVRWRNYWQEPLPACDGIYVFLLNPYMSRLDAKIKREKRGRRIKLVSFAFQVPNKKPAAVSAEMAAGLYLYRY